MDASAGERSHVVDFSVVVAQSRQLRAETTVDLRDDLEDAGEDLLEDGRLPRLQGLGEDRVVRVREGFLDDLPGVLPAQAVFVQEQAHEFGNGEDRVGVVELDDVVLAEIAQVVAVDPHVRLDHRLERGGHEEVLLAHPQDFALVGGVVGVEDPAQIGHALAFDDGLREELGVEGRVVELLDGFRLPQPQVVDVACPVAGDRHVVGDRADVHVGEMNVFRFLLVTDGEGVSLLHPRVGVLVLEAVVDRLLEQAVAIEDAVAGDREFEGRAGVEEAGRQAAEAAVAQGGVGFLFQDVGEVLAVGG